jgi:hypothetical protein
MITKSLNLANSEEVEHCVRTDCDVSPNQDKDSYAEYQESETELSQTSN